MTFLWYEPPPHRIVRKLLVKRDVFRIKNTIPEGFKLHHTLQGFGGKINRMVWSPNETIIASPSDDHTIRLWDAEKGKLLRTLSGHLQTVYSLAWSPNGHLLASSSADRTIGVWDTETGQLTQILEGHLGEIKSLAWSPDGQNLASGGDDQVIALWDVVSSHRILTFGEHLGSVHYLAWSPNGQVLASTNDEIIRLWDSKTGQCLSQLVGQAAVHSITWSLNGEMLASASDDDTIVIWDTKTEKQKYILEGHVNRVISISFSFDNRLLASKSQDGTIRFWRCDTWETVALLKELSSGETAMASLAFHPQKPILATLGKNGSAIRIWRLDVEKILGIPPASSSALSPPVHYSNAKIILVGDTGVGKSGLALVLTGQPFSFTESTHGCRIWTFSNQETVFDKTGKEVHEAFLWDLAGQPGYRIIHQLYLNDIAVALVVFDNRSETNPFAGVKHWDRAIRTAKSIQGNPHLPIKKFLIAGRTDRGGIGVSRNRIESLMSELEFDEYFETSALQGEAITPLIEKITNSIDWEALPKVSSTELFQQIKEFLIEQKETGLTLSTADELYRTYLNFTNPQFDAAELRAQFETCINLIEGRGLIRRLNFGALILLQPELLDAYAAALINSVRDEPDGLGSISEEKVLSGNFSIPMDQRISDQLQEKLLLIALVEDLLRHEIVLREKASEGPYLIFPSQSTRENLEMLDPEGKTFVFRFEGPVLNIYASLIVRLSHTDVFLKKEIWKNAVTFTAKLGGTCGVSLSSPEEGYGELTLFFDKTTNEDVRFLFEEFISIHLKRWSLPGSFKRRRVFECSECATPFTDLQVEQRRSRGFDFIRCSVCDNSITLRERDEWSSVVDPITILEMDETANKQRDTEARVSTSTTLKEISGSTISRNFDVYLCYNKEDLSEVEIIGEKLRSHGIIPWLDEWELPPGKPWQSLLEEQIEKIKSAAVFVGKAGIGPWQQLEVHAFMREFVQRGCPIIPVLLKSATKEPTLPIILKGMTWVDFRRKKRDTLDYLIWGITGKRSFSKGSRDYKN